MRERKIWTWQPIGGLLSDQFRYESKSRETFFSRRWVDKMLRVFEFIERRFTKLGESYGYVENWVNKTTMNSGVGRNSMKKKKKNDNNLLHGSDTSSLCNCITLILKCPIQIGYWIQWNTMKQQKGVNHKSIPQHGYWKHNVKKSKLKNTCHLIPFISSVVMRYF